MTAFGKDFSRALRDGCSDLRVYPEWVLQVLAYESGLNPQQKNSHGARGLFQKMPTFRCHVPLEKKPQPGSKQVVLPGKDDDGNPCWSLYDCYPVDDPAQQLRDAFKFWTALIHEFGVPGFDTREKFYCLNLWPAALKGGYATPQTRILTTEDAYRANRQLDSAGRGYITIADLAQHLDEAQMAYSDKIADEMQALLAVDVPEPPAAA